MIFQVGFVILIVCKMNGANLMGPFENTHTMVVFLVFELLAVAGPEGL